MAKKKEVAEKEVKKVSADKAVGPVPTININGKDYIIDNLSDTAKSLLTVYNTWQADREAAIKALNDAKIVVAKNEAALRDLSKEIVELVEAPDVSE
jgi:hypothetical protein